MSDNGNDNDNDTDTDTGNDRKSATAAQEPPEPPEPPQPPQPPQPPEPTETGTTPTGDTPSSAGANTPAVPAVPSTKSQRSREDAAAPMGVGTTDVGLRVLASLGEISHVPANFDQPCFDVTRGGVLLALPALMACGLLRHASRFFSLPPGYYGLESIFLLLAFMALSRIRNIEGLRYTAPGEWGKILGLDRCPEAKTLREKISILTTADDAVGPWAAQLCQDWMEASQDATGVLYVDGHCRVYHGHQTQLPRHYIARQKLCLRATTDYWVHGLDGMPFFKVNQAIDPGLIKTLEETIVPRLESSIPGQPTAEELAAEPLRQRFAIVCDRESFSPGYFKRMNAKRIAVQTYLKNPGPDWPEAEFTPHQIRLLNGDTATMMLAERGTLLGRGPDQLWMREVRKLCESGHQVAIVSTQWLATVDQIVAPQFGRWYQENWFKYAREHFDLDGLINYQLEPLDDTTKLVNPAWRALDSDARKRQGKLQKLHAKLGKLKTEQDMTPGQAQAYTEQATALMTEVTTAEQELDEVKAKRRSLPKHITVAELPEGTRFQQLATRSKHFVDTIKIIAYRAETAMAATIKEELNEHHRDEARAIVRAICETEADLTPDAKARTLTVTLHSLANPKHNAAAARLCASLNETETTYPGTDLKMVFEMVFEKVSP